MVDQLSSFADEVTRVAKEVGTEGKLGGQAQVEGVSGTWRGLTENVNQLASNLTTQVRAIAEVSTAVTQGDLTRSITVEASGEVAALKDNINEMIRNLKDTTLKNSEQDWLKTNLAKFSRMLQGQKDLLTVGRLILSELAPVVSAQHARADVADGLLRQPAAGVHHVEGDEALLRAGDHDPAVADVHQLHLVDLQLAALADLHALASELGIRLVLVHVEQRGAHLPTGALDFAARLDADIRRRLRLLHRAADTVADAEVEVFLAAGSPVQALREAALREAAELIAVGTRGHGTLKAVALGSVSRALCTASPRPVLIVGERTTAIPADPDRPAG
jgi:nucleotide-binding universal stress UspA family protein/HAMP domain-containing protein